MTADAAPSPTGDTAPLDIALDALRLIAGDKCRNYTSGTRCYDEGWGRTRGAQYSAEAWCDSCIAQDALTRAAVSSSSPDDTAPGDVDFLLSESERMLAQHAADVAEIDRLRSQGTALAGQRDTALALHFRRNEGGSEWCGGCNSSWPCPTVRALTEETR